MLSLATPTEKNDDNRMCRRKVDSTTTITTSSTGTHGGRPNHSSESRPPPSRSNTQQQGTSRSHLPPVRRSIGTPNTTTATTGITIITTTTTGSKEHRALFWLDRLRHGSSFVSTLPSFRIRRTYHCVLQILIGIMILIALLHNVHLGRYYNNSSSSSFSDTFDKSLEYRALRGPNDATLTVNHLPPIHNESDLFRNILWWNGENSIEQQQIVDSNNQRDMLEATERKKRSSPPKTQSSILPMSLRIPNSTTTAHPIHIPFVNQTHQEWNWAELCQNANLNPHSRVVITNAMVTSRILGPALSLLISKQCHVKSMTVVDPILPNVHSLRIHAMQLYRILYRTIPRFTFLVPMASAGLATVPDPKTRPVEIHATLHWLHNLAPTHIIHLDPMIVTENTTNSILWNDYMTIPAYRRYQIQNSILSMQQILQYSYQKYRKDNHTMLQLLHVVDTTKSNLLAADDRKTSTNTFTNHDPKYVVMVNATRRIHHVLSDFYFSKTDGLIAFHTLNLPTSILESYRANHHTEPLPSISVTIEDAIASILIALQAKPQRTRELVEYEINTTRPQLIHHSMNTTLPLTQRNTPSASMFLLNPDHQYNGRGDMASPIFSSISSDDADHVQSIYGIHLSQFPCASSCRNTLAVTQCAATVFDRVMTVSRTVTGNAQCKFVIYMVDYNVKRSHLYKTKQSIGRSDKLCRLAFVSSQSSVVNQTLNKMIPTWTKDDAAAILQTWNGKLESNGWTLIWLPVQQHNNFEPSMSVSEYALLRMEPSQFFDRSVQKAMYVDNEDIARASDTILLRIMQQMDHPALPIHWIRERRSGMDVVSRFVERPARAARAVAMFLSEPPQEYIPKSYEEFVRRIHNVSSIPETSFTMTPEFLRRLNYYKDVKSYVMQDRYRPDIETSNTISTIYPTFPWQWISMDVLVHDVTMESARHLRCSWYDEYLYWTEAGKTNNTSKILFDVMEELSFAFLVGIQRMKGLIGPNIHDDKSWIPLYERKLPILDLQPLHNNDDDKSEVFLRVMKA